MRFSPAVRWGVGFVAVILALFILRFKPWHRASAFANRPTLTVGYLPVT